LLKRKTDVQADGLSASFSGSAVRRFHNARTTATGDDETASGCAESVRPSGHSLREMTGILVVAAHGTRFKRAGGAEEHDRVVNFLITKMSQRVQVLGEETDRTSVRRIHEAFIAVGSRQVPERLEIIVIVFGHEADAALSSSAKRFSNCR